MPAAITVPTLPASGPVQVTIGKHSRSWGSAAEAIEWAEGNIQDRDFAFTMAIILSKRRPGTIGKTLNFNPAATANLLTVS